MSKVMYHADTVIGVADQYFEEQLEEAVKDEVGETEGVVWVKDALKWSKEAIEFANKDFECPQPLVETWGNLYMNVLHAIDQALNESAPTPNSDQITAALRKFVSMHEAGLLPSRFTYEEGKRALEGVGTNNDAIEFAEWIEINAFMSAKKEGWLLKGSAHLDPISTADLHQLWQQSKSK